MTGPRQVPEEVLEKFILGFEGPTLSAELKEYLGAGLTGVILFPRNFTDVQELLSLTEEIRRTAGRPVLIGIDQEGGTRFSLPEPFTQWVSPEELGWLEDAGLVERQARALGQELQAAGCNLDFAPMLDLALRPESPVTRGRSLGSDPQKVARLGAAFIRGLISGGILSCGKHFPGHGDTITDPHHDLPTFGGTLARLRESELVPFAGAITAGVPFIMTAHISLPELDPKRPASLSRTLLQTILRHQMRFEGVILADDLGMGAIAKRWGPRKAAVETFRAGSDLALLCHDWSLVQVALEGVSEALKSGQFDKDEWRRSRRRIAQVRKSAADAVRGMPRLSVIGSAEHRELVREIRSQLAERKDRP